MAVSSGGAAGIGIGCLIAGVLICGLAFYVLGPRRHLWRRKKSGIDEDGNLEESIIGEKTRGGTHHIDGGCVVPTPSAEGQASHSRSGSDSSVSTATIGTIEFIDHEVREEFHCLNVAIKGHAELYYNLRPIEEPNHKNASCDTNIATLTDLLGPAAPLDGIAMDCLLQEPATRHDSIRLLLAWVVFRFTQLDAPMEKTLLPPELVKCAQAMSRSAAMVDEAAARRRSEVRRKPLPLNSNPGVGASNRKSEGSSEQDERLSFAKWREMSGKLFEPIYGAGKVKVGDARLKNIDEMVTTLVCLLQPYVAKGYGGARVRDLENVVKAAAGFGYKLFTQRTEWEFAWSTLMSDELVVYPALVKVGDDRGHKLRQSIVLSWEETVKLNEPVLDAVQKRASDLRTIAEHVAEQ
ncbi:hypothetical protein Slin15195_G103680 [Septoria linicola]|uniref:Uncharacterized protein n=1 Tax=Septoria linicola TaxID=215465 RepID=A0A9Q9AX49_9PEZI|nr:hypothetical protein Slin15195_G103680 [Septoria linicola]